MIMKKENPKTIFKYKIILFRDDKYMKSISFLRDGNYARKKYEKLLSESKKISYPKDMKQVKNKYVKTKYYLKLVKLYEEGDKKRIIRDKLGKLIEEELLINNWLTIRSDEYYIEEDFQLFSIGRVTLPYLNKYIIDGVKGRGIYKMVLMVNNKIIIYNESDFDLINCRSIKQCEKLYNKLMLNSFKSKINGLIFNGVADRSNITTYYDLIQEETGWGRRYIKHGFNNYVVKSSIDC